MKTRKQLPPLEKPTVNYMQALHEAIQKHLKTKTPPMLHNLEVSDTIFDIHNKATAQDINFVKKLIQSSVDRNEQTHSLQGLVAEREILDEEVRQQIKKEHSSDLLVINSEGIEESQKQRRIELQRIRDMCAPENLMDLEGSLPLKTRLGAFCRSQNSFLELKRQATLDRALGYNQEKQDMVRQRRRDEIREAIQRQNRLVQEIEKDKGNRKRYKLRQTSFSFRNMGEPSIQRAPSNDYFQQVSLNQDIYAKQTLQHFHQRSASSNYAPQPSANFDLRATLQTFQKKCDFRTVSSFQNTSPSSLPIARLQTISPKRKSQDYLSVKEIVTQIALAQVNSTASEQRKFQVKKEAENLRYKATDQLSQSLECLSQGPPFAILKAYEMDKYSQFAEEQEYREIIRDFQNTKTDPQMTKLLQNTFKKNTMKLARTENKKRVMFQR